MHSGLNDSRELLPLEHDGRRDDRNLILGLIAVVGSAILTLVLAFAAARAGSGAAPETSPSEVPSGTAAGGAAATGAATGLYGFTLPDLDGKPVALSAYRGKVLLLVNTASKCGFTPQYEALEGLSKAYRDRGLVVLGFPANNFHSQEPGTNAEIKSFCSTKYGVDFPMFGKISVKGADIHPLYRWLTASETDPGFSGDIQWNFTKFLVDREGKVIARFPSATRPDSPELKAAVENALAAA
jgi:glutathione peroxidase